MPPPPIGRVPILPGTTPTKTPWKPRICLTGKVNDLMLWAMTGNSSWESEHSISEKEATEEVVMPPSPKSEDPIPPIDSSSQASMEEGNVSMESNPVIIFPITAAYSSYSDIPLVDLTELQMDANLAANHLLSIKRSMDHRRQGVIWELRLLLQQNEADEAASIKKARAVHR